MELVFSICLRIIIKIFEVSVLWGVGGDGLSNSCYEAMLYGQVVSKIEI